MTHESWVMSHESWVMSHESWVMSHVISFLHYLWHKYVLEPFLTIKLPSTECCKHQKQSNNLSYWGQCLAWLDLIQNLLIVRCVFGNWFLYENFKLIQGLAETNDNCYIKIVPRNYKDLSVEVIEALEALILRSNLLYQIR